jgi:hypothetical protein
VNSDDKHRGSSDQLLLLLELVGRELRERARTLAAELTDPQLRGLIIAEDEFDQLLGQPLNASPFAALAQLAEPAPLGSWRCLLDRLGLSSTEGLVILICLLPEVDRAYERIFGYLQDNVTARRPSVDLLLRLLWARPPDRIAGRRLFWPAAPLRRLGLVVLRPEDDHSAGLLSQQVALHPVLVEHLLHDGAPPAPEHPAVRLPDRVGRLAADSQQAQAMLGWLRDQAAERLWVHVQAPYAELARALAQAACAAWQVPLVELDLSQADDADLAARGAALEALMRDGALLVSGLGDEQPGTELRTRVERVAAVLGDLPRPLFWHCSLQVPLAAPRGVLSATCELPAPDYAQRLTLWREALPERAPSDATALQAVAGRYRLSPERIAWSARTASEAAVRRGPAATVGFGDLAEAARRASSRDIGQLAHRIEPRHGWQDLVLPADRIAQLQEMCDQLAYRPVVMEQWGYGRGSAAPGLSALFAGPSGTGKTMAAEVIAGELGLDLYRIDLSGVVSKYIGETEKNLERIFTLARDANAILLFDEADALFGKRSETRDAHDRYANIEVSYLLQKIEEYDGLVILTSNLRQNLDEAFMRRLQLSVDFPFPDEQARLRIWQKLITPQTPVGSLDLEQLARRFRLSGGSIRNVVLTAAFLAARDGEALNTDYVTWAVRREYQKLGRLVEAGQFGGEERIGAGTAEVRGWGDA